VPIIQFKGKTAVESYHRVVPHHTLEIDPKLSLAKQPSLDGNLIIEGDNLIALKSLLPTHAGKIQCIYIDAPYNTGNEEWIYNDNLTQPQFKEWIGQVVGKEGEDACRHDKWCCMMYPRLQLLKELLHDDGVIFMSIDDNELQSLLFLCDEVFDRANRFGVIIVQNNPRGRRLGTELAVEHEYLVVYAKRLEQFKAGRLELNEEQLAEYSEVDRNGRKCRLLGLRKRGALARRIDRPNLHFPIYVNPETGEIALDSEKGFAKVLPKLSDGTEGVWRWGKPKVGRDRALLVGRLVKRRETGKSEWDVFEFDHPDEADGALKGRLFPSIWQGSEFNNETGRDQIKELFGEAVFNYPKPVDLIKHALLLSGVKTGFVLDSFAGSGTTGQAVAELNQADGGSRNFVLIQQPHDTKKDEEHRTNIAQAVTAERVRRVMEGFSLGKENVPGIGGEFTYARVGKMLMGEYRDLGDKLPSFEEVARYIYFTETSQIFDASKVDKATGKIGEWKNTSYYLLYSPNRKEDQALDMGFLKGLKDKNPRKVIYCEKVWVHREDLSQFGDIRPMLVPFNLK
jgi:adenine-specific DNA-methyltransferase